MNDHNNKASAADVAKFDKDMEQASELAKDMGFSNDELKMADGVIDEERQHLVDGKESLEDAEDNVGEIVAANLAHDGDNMAVDNNGDDNDRV